MPRHTRKAHLCGRAFRAGVRNRKRRMAIVKRCTFTPGGVSAVRGGNTALWMPYTADCRGAASSTPRGSMRASTPAANRERDDKSGGLLLAGNSPSRRGAFYRRPSTGSSLRADTGPAPAEAREKITRYRTAYGCSRAGASSPHQRCSRLRRRRRAGRPSRG